MRIARRGQHHATVRARFSGSRRTLGALAGVLALGVAGTAAVVLVPLSASAATTPPFEPDTNAVGAITFFDASGAQVTHGNLTDPLPKYAQGSGTPRAGDTKATLFGYVPKNGQVPGQYSGELLTGASAYPNASAPGTLATSALPLQTGNPATDSNFGFLVGDFPNTATDTYAGLYEIRLVTSAVGLSASQTYDRVDIQVSNVTEDGSGTVTGGTWTQVYPTPPAQVAQSTTTTLTASPTSPAAHGSSVTLSAAVTPTAAGSVDFKEGTTDLGAATVSAGVATKLLTPADGSHSYTATFTPTDSTAFTASTSTALAYVINAAPAAVTTTTSLAVSPANTSVVGTSTTLTASIAPAGAVGAIEFLDGTTQIGVNVPVSAGTAATSTTALGVGTHPLTAKFVPTDSGAYKTSTSTVTSYVVTSVPVTATSTTFSVSPAGPIAFGASVTLSASESPSAAGTIQFMDGSTALGTPQAVTAGAASLTTTALTSGSHQLSAKFVPTDTATFGGSSSAASTLVVDAQTTTTSLAVTPGGPVTHGSSVDLSATLTPNTAAGKIQFMDGSTALGAPVTVASGAAQLSTTALTVATHSLTAVFTPTSSAAFGTSTSSAVSLEVDPAPAGSTSTTLTVSPASPVVQGKSVTLLATVTPATATGSVQFEDGTTPIGTPVSIVNGKASTTTSSLTVGSHTLAADYVSSDTTVLLDSTGSSTLVVNPPPTATTTALTAAASSAQVGDAVDLTATVSPAAAGDIQFADNGVAIGGMTPVANGVATASVSFGTAGSHALTAVFTPTDVTAFATSTGTLALSVTVPVTSNNVTSTDASGDPLSSSPSLTGGQQVTVTITGADPNAVLTVTLHSTPVTVGTVTADANGAATFTFTVPAGLTGGHTLIFTEANGTRVGQLAFTAAAAAVVPATPVTPAAGADTSGTTLANTGSNVQVLLGFGLLLIIAGGVMITVVRRRATQG